jgi:hypothetical protein
MAEDLTKSERDELIANVMIYQEKLYKLQNEVGRLDDIYESPLINFRMPQIGYVGAYQYIQRAIDQLEGYIYEVEQYA